MQDFISLSDAVSESYLHPTIPLDGIVSFTVYTNSFLAALNARKNVRGCNTASQMVISMPTTLPAPATSRQRSVTKNISVLVQTTREQETSPLCVRFLVVSLRLTLNIVDGMK